MSDKMEPALDADEWFHRSARIGERDFAASASITSDGPGHADSLTLEEHADDSQVWVTDAAGLAKLVALANAALPDISPHKITHADVAFLREVAANSLSAAAVAMDQMWPERSRASRRHGEMFGQLADKLAALLPPTRESPSASERGPREP